jgi:hypothetical protein
MSLKFIFGTLPKVIGRKKKTSHPTVPKKLLKRTSIAAYPDETYPDC